MSFYQQQKNLLVIFFSHETSERDGQNRIILNGNFLHFQFENDVPFLFEVKKNGVCFLLFLEAPVSWILFQ